MNTSSHDERAVAPSAHLDRLLTLVDEVDFVEQLDRAEGLMDRRRDELLRERRAAVRARRRSSHDATTDDELGTVDTVDTADTIDTASTRTQEGIDR